MGVSLCFDGFQEHFRFRDEFQKRSRGFDEVSGPLQGISGMYTGSTGLLYMVSEAFHGVLGRSRIFQRVSGCFRGVAWVFNEFWRHFRKLQRYSRGLKERSMEIQGI